MFLSKFLIKLKIETFKTKESASRILNYQFDASFPSCELENFLQIDASSSRHLKFNILKLTLWYVVMWLHFDFID